jgi:DNA-binding LacI/PurR family transcriptional regulator
MNITLNRSDSDAMYVQLSNQLQAYVVAKKLQPGTMLPNIKTIAQHAGVSLKTAERALNKLIESGVCIRRPKKGTFVANPNRIKKQLAKNEALSCMAFILCGTDFAKPYHARVLKGAEEMASVKNLHLICASVPLNNSKMLLAKIKNMLAQSNLQAVLIGGKVSDEDITSVIELLGDNVPTIIMGRTTHGFFDGVSHITDSNGLAIRIALQSLQDSGHRNIAFLNEPLRWAWNREMRDTFYSFMEINNLPLYPEAIMDDLPGDTMNDGYAGTIKMLPQLKKNGITAIVCGTDNLARGAMKALKENSFKIPDDISVIGCGNLDFCEYLEPPLTSVDQCEEEKGREGILAATGEYQQGTIVRIPVQLVERGTTKGV